MTIVIVNSARIERDHSSRDGIRENQKKISSESTRCTASVRRFAARNASTPRRIQLGDARLRKIEPARHVHVAHVCGRQKKNTACAILAVARVHRYPQDDEAACRRGSVCIA